MRYFLKAILALVLVLVALWLPGAIRRGHDTLKYGLGNSLVGEALAQVGCVPNPNDNGAPFVNHCPITAKGLNTLANAVGFGLPQTATNNSLQTISTAFSSLIRLGFAAAGDSGAPLLYTHSGSACSLNSGLGDNISQVRATDGTCWLSQALSSVDVRAAGGACGTDSTTAMSAIVAALATQGPGGRIEIPCNITISSQITVSSGTKITGVAAYGATNPLWSPNGAGNQNPTILCTNQSNSCLRLSGFGIEISGLQFANNEPTPPSTGSSWPGYIHFPPIIDTNPNVSWGDIYIHNVKCIPCSKFIDFEGTANYSAYAGTQIIVRDFQCGACLDYGITVHRIDNPLIIDHGEWTPTDYYFSYPAVGAQLRTAVGMDFHYVAAPQVHDLNFFSLGKAWTFENDSVTNNFGTITFAESALEADRIMFNQVCQAIVGQGNGTNTSSGGVATDGTNMNYAKFTQIDIWGDQSGFQCAKGKKLIQLETNQGNVSFAHVNVYNADQVFALGCGTVGTASCPAGGPGGNLVVRLDDLDITQYGEWTAGTPFATAPSNVTINFGTTNLAAIRPAAGAGNIIAAGLDGTTAVMGQICAGGGSNGIYGAACLAPGGAIASGTVNFFDTSHNQQGSVGAAVAAGINLSANNGSVFLNSKNGTHSATAQFGANTSGQNLINLNPLPTSPPSGTGSGYACLDNQGTLYFKTSCP